MEDGIDLRGSIVGVSAIAQFHLYMGTEEGQDVEQQQQSVLCSPSYRLTLTPLMEREKVVNNREIVV